MLLHSQHVLFGSAKGPGATQGGGRLWVAVGAQHSARRKGRST